MFEQQFHKRSAFHKISHLSSVSPILNVFLQNQAFKIKSDIQRLQKCFYSEQNSIILNIFSIVQRNSSYMNHLSEKIDILDSQLSSLNQQLNFFNQKNIKQQQQTYEDQIKINENQNQQKKTSSRTHYKMMFKQKIFGIRQYKYKLVIEGNLPMVFYKQRNINFNVRLATKQGQFVFNQHQFSLNLKAYYSNGQQVEQTKKGHNFMKGSITTLMMYGKASFDKLCPREVTSKLQKKKIIIVIYASKMRNIVQSNTFEVDPNQIEPFILYGIKVITKQKEKFQNKDKKIKDIEENQSQYLE